MADQARAYVVTGGGSGIGRATALLLRQRGAQVAVIDCDCLKAEAVAQECGAIPIVANVADESQVIDAFAAVAHQFGRLDGLLSNAGIARVEGPLHEEPASIWDEVVGVNLRGTFLVLREGLKLMVPHRRGSIVCTASVVSTAAIAGFTTAYTASKGAISALVRQVAVDYAPLGIRVNSVAPGATDTALMWDTTPPSEVESTREIIDRAVPLGRLGDPTEVANAVVWLMSDEAAYVTGVELLVDGGTNAKSTLPV
jgi:NAD(P)-dependent dehydrogenase (short-subunit alcohol dehydrogenase family)